MSYVAAAIVIGTGVNMYGNIQEGKAKKAEAYDAARQLERERELTKIQATQSMTAMAQDYSMATSANDAFFAGVLGRVAELLRASRWSLATGFGRRY